ncbi:hypothetical protein JCM10207_001989 [Rhodosporidiobolus poonsookiae]
MASLPSSSLDMLRSTPAPPPAVAAFLNLNPAERSGQAGAPALLGLLQTLAGGYDPAPEHRRKLIAALLASASSTADGTSPLTIPLCTTLKLLGRSPAGSEELGRKNGLETLVRLCGLERVADVPHPPPLAEESPDADDDEAKAAQHALEQVEKDLLTPPEAEALRCLCNTLTLHPAARDAFPNVLLADEKRTALRGMVRILGTGGGGFLGGRLLFLVTSKASEVISELAHSGVCIAAMEQFAQRYLVIYNSPSHRSLLSSGPPTSTMDDVLREHLKLAYNLMLQYSRQPNDVPEGFSKASSEGHDEAGGKKRRFWRSREKSGASSPGSPNSPELGAEQPAEPSNLEAALSSSPPKAERARSKSPLSFAKRAVDAVKHRTSSATSSPETPKSSTSPSPNSGTPPSARLTDSGAQEGTSPDALSLTASHLFLPIFQPYLSIATLLPVLPPPTPAAPKPSFKDPSPTVRAALATLLNFPVELEELSGWSSSWLQYVPPRLAPDGSVLKGGGLGSLGGRLLELLEGVCEAYFPSDRVPENPKLLTQKAREHGRQLEAPVEPDEWIPVGEGEATKIEEILGPVMLLLRKISMLGEAQHHFRERLLPATTDRTLPLDRHASLAGHLVRLLSSVLLPNTSFGVGEFIYNLCDRDPLTLVRAIGYGNASGFLQNRSELIPPPSGEDAEASTTAPEGGERRVNPITGAFEAEEDPNFVPMSEAEKEREAERLYTLFDRMARTGVISAENPVDKARAEGRFEETNEEREAELERLRREDEELEEEVARDMKEWKDRRKKAADEKVDPAKLG